MPIPSKFIIRKVSNGTSHLSIDTIIDDKSKKDFFKQPRADADYAIIHFRKKYQQKGFNIFTGQYLAYKDKSEKKYNEHTNVIEDSKLIENEIQDADNFFIIFNGSSYFLIYRELFNHKKNYSLIDDLEKFFDGLIKFEKFPTDDLYTSIAKLEDIVEIEVKIDTKEDINTIMGILNENWFPTLSEEFISSIKEKTFREKIKPNSPHGKGVKIFSKNYINFLNGKPHETSHLKEYLKNPHLHEKYNLSEIEQAVILSTFCKNAKCKIHGHNNDQRNILIDLEEINQNEKVIELHVKKDEFSRETSPSIIDEIIKNCLQI